jgi:prevent-host-death family protein
MIRLSATEVARQFSAILNRVDAGEEIEVTRNGVPMMLISPVPRRQSLSSQRWRELMASLPPVDEDFARDVETARKEIVEPREIPWPS